MMTADAANVAALAHPAVKAASDHNLVVALVMTDAAHAAIKLRGAAPRAMIAVARAGMIVGDLLNGAKYHPLCRKSMLPWCPMKKASSPWRVRSK